MGCIVRRRAAVRGNIRQGGRACHVPRNMADNEFHLPPKLATTAEALKSLPNDRLRYQQLLSLANKLPPMAEGLKTPGNKVPGCVSVVHVHAVLNEDGTVAFSGDSDALISKGLVSLLVLGLTGCT